MAVQKLYEAENEQGITKFWRRLGRRAEKAARNKTMERKKQSVTKFRAEKQSFSVKRRLRRSFKAAEGKISL